MLAKENCLRKKKDIERVFKQGKGFKQGFLFLKIAKNDLTLNRFAIVVSKKISLKAVIRNKIKRRLRAATRARLNEMEQGWDTVIVAQQGLENENFEEIKKLLNKLFAQAKLFNDGPN